METVRQGLCAATAGREIADAKVFRERTLRRHPGGSKEFSALLTGRQVTRIGRRGKYLWLHLDDESALVAHLGMSGQFRYREAAEQCPSGPAFAGHERARITFTDGTSLAFVDQRTFGWLLPDDLVADTKGSLPAVPRAVSHIAMDPLEPGFQSRDLVRAIRRRPSGIKRLLLDQTLVSGIGNIYADESLWRTRLHYDRAGSQIPAGRLHELLGHVSDVLMAALAAGGTSFDALYVNVNGSSGWFSRALDVYGREDEKCSRCAGRIVREPFMNRSSYRCPRCQRRPRRPASARG